MTTRFRSESGAMRLARRLGFERLAWSLRRLHCPVPDGALVLEVGSGGNPYPRANVLLDAYEDTIERYHLPLVMDRPLVYGFVERMPFRDKAFDFVIASHVLEHTSEPEKFLDELMRVGKAGYIETPDAFIERIIPFRFHRLEVTDRNGKLIIYKKPSWRPHSELVDLFEPKLKGPEFIALMKRHPAPFYVRFYWDERILYSVVNPEVDAGWDFPTQAEGSNAVQRGLLHVLRGAVIRLARRIWSQQSRNKNIDLLPLLRCPTCLAGMLERLEGDLECGSCGSRYSVRGGAPWLFPKEAH